MCGCEIPGVSFLIATLGATTFWILYGVASFIITILIFRLAQTRGPLDFQYVLSDVKAGAKDADEYGWSMTCFIICLVIWPGIATIITINYFFRMFAWFLSLAVSATTNSVDKVVPNVSIKFKDKED